MTPSLPLPRRFRWLPGMMRLRHAPGMADHLRREGRVPDGRDDWDDAAWPAVPDLSDPATIGALVALVREAYGRPDASVAWQETPDHRGWAVVRAGRVLDLAPTEAAALWAALEAAP